MAPQVLVFVYVLSLLAGLSFLAIYSEIRSRHFRPARKPDRVFRCDTCGSGYTDDADVDPFAMRAMRDAQ